ncbi:UNVERIFIED_CONTAM: hypothetical protein K2H54_040649 [Gekko kuhli]
METEFMSVRRDGEEQDRVKEPKLDNLNNAGNMETEFMSVRRDGEEQDRVKEPKLDNLNNAGNMETEFMSVRRVMMLKEGPLNKETEDEQKCGCLEFIKVKVPIHIVLSNFYELGILGSDYVEL